MTELPESKGAYVLIASVAQTKRLAIGRLGEFIIISGFYAYVGSACSHGGIRARVSHHLESIAQPHWYIDYLLGFATPIEVWYAISDRKLEQDWAKMLQDSPKFRTPTPRFGSSDYHRTRTTCICSTQSAVLCSGGSRRRSGRFSSRASELNSLFCRQASARRASHSQAAKSWCGCSSSLN
jgi:Uri superfamily endonuclease